MYIYYIINNIYYTILSNIINSIITEKGYVKSSEKIRNRFTGNQAIFFTGIQ